MGRFFLCLVVAWCLVALLVAPVHGRAVSGLAGEFGGDHRPAPATSFDHVAEPKQPRGVKGSRPAWSWSWSSTSSRRGDSAGAVAELRSVPAGPDPMHHHGSPRRPEHDRSIGSP